MAYGSQVVLIVECFPARMPHSGLIAQFPPGLGCHRRPGTADRDGVPRSRGICPVELRRRHRSDDPIAGLHQPRHLGATSFWAGRERGWPRLRPSAEPIFPTARRCAWERASRMRPRDCIASAGPILEFLIFIPRARTRAITPTSP
jgi:hypothetical protein